MTMIRPFAPVAAAAVLLFATACGGDDAGPDAPTGLTALSYAAYRAEIGPQPDDAAWDAIDWLPSYREGLEAAAAEDKPILLWVMNGHPLGCT